MSKRKLPPLLEIIEILASIAVIALMIGVGHYWLNMGLKGAIDFSGANPRYTYMNKMFWFFSSITLISAAAFFYKYKTFQHKIVMFIIAFVAQFVGYTMSGGLTFDVGDVSLGINAVLIAKAAFIFMIVISVAFALISYWFSDTPTEFIKSILKSVGVIGIIALAGMFVVPNLLFLGMPGIVALAGMC